MMQGNASGAGEMDGFIAEGKSGGVVDRLKKLMEARHEATVKNMMEELEEHQQQWREQQEEKKKLDDGEEDNMLEQVRTERQYAQLQNELQLQHQQSLSTLDSLTPYEMSIAQGNVIDPSNLSVTFADVGGMDDIKSEIYDLVVLPLVRPDLFMSDSGLVSPPKGILLYGPPGTGKTMLAKAIAKESHATFVNVQLSTIMNKWFGESNKLISATFHLARKLAPSVVFIDEMDAFLSQRDGTEGSAVNSMKSEFLTLWDGLLSERSKKVMVEENGEEKNSGLFRKKNSNIVDTAQLELESETPMLPNPPIIVLGATNRPYDVDPAILRRLPRSFEIPLPPLQSRLQLLQLFLEKQSMSQEAKIFLPEIAKRTEGYSGSDLKELCRAAAWEPVRELTTGASRRAAGCDNDTEGNNGKNKSAVAPVSKRTSSGFPPRGAKARPVNKHDFLLAIQKVKKTGESARQFHTKEFLRVREERANTAADISKATNGNADKDQSSSKRNGKGSNNGQMTNIDVQQLMTAMATAMSVSSLNDSPLGNANAKSLLFGDLGDSPSLQESNETEEDEEDDPPEMSE